VKDRRHAGAIPGAFSQVDNTTAARSTPEYAANAAAKDGNEAESLQS
jgi:hypothetical protein